MYDSSSVGSLKFTGGLDQVIDSLTNRQWSVVAHDATEVMSVAMLHDQVILHAGLFPLETALRQAFRGGVALSCYLVSRAKRTVNCN